MAMCLLLFSTISADPISQSSNLNSTEVSDCNSLELSEETSTAKIITSIDLIAQNKTEEAEILLNYVVHSPHTSAAIKEEALLCICLLNIIKGKFDQAEVMLLDFVKYSKNLQLLDYAYYLLSRLYFQIRDFSSSIIYLKKISSNDEEAKSLINEILFKIIDATQVETNIDAILEIEGASDDIITACAEAKKIFRELDALKIDAIENRYNNLIIGKNFNKKSHLENKDTYNIGIFFCIDGSPQNICSHKIRMIKNSIEDINSKYGSSKFNFTFINLATSFKSLMDQLNSLDNDCLDIAVVFDKRVEASNYLISQYCEKKKIPMFNLGENIFIDKNPYYRIIIPSFATILNSLLFFTKKTIKNDAKIVVLRLNDDDGDFLVQKYVDQLRDAGYSKLSYYNISAKELSVFINQHLKKYKGKNVVENRAFSEIIKADYIFILSYNEFLVNCIISLLKAEKSRPSVVILGDSLNAPSISIEQVVELEPYIFSDIDLFLYRDYNSRVVDKFVSKFCYAPDKESLLIYFGLDIICTYLFMYGKNFLVDLIHPQEELNGTYVPNFYYDKCRDPQNYYCYKIDRKSKNNYSINKLNF